jgi:8-oxo-dGTP pyrophosphatase MutT (NUDIX family)
MARERFKLSVSVFLLLKKRDEILLLKREHTGWMDGFYSIPAGAIDGKETLLEAAVREAKEEVGVTVNPDDIMLFHTMHCFTHGEEWLGQFFVTEKWIGQPKVNEPHKHSEIKWTEVTQLPDNIIQYVKQAIDCFQKEILYSSYHD